MDIITYIIGIIIIGAIIWWASSVKNSLENIEYYLKRIDNEQINNISSTDLPDLIDIESKLDTINDNLEKISDELSQIETNTDKDV